MFFNQLIILIRSFALRFNPKRALSSSLHASILQDATSFELKALAARNEINRIHLYFMSVRYAFKLAIPLYLFVVFCYFDIASTFELALWFSLTLLLEIALFMVTKNFDLDKVTVQQAQNIELKENFLHVIKGLIWSLGGYLLATHTAVPLQLQYLHVVFGVALCTFAVPVLTYSLRGLVVYIFGASAFNLFYLIQHYDTMYLWFYGYLGLMATCVQVGYQMHNQAKEVINTSALNDLMSIRLSAKNEELHQHANIDVLTGLHNRRYIVDQLTQLVSQAERYHSVCNILLIDIDHFKKVNDIHGHLVGDDVLVDVALLLKSTLRDSDLIGRYGGEEFLALLPMTNLKEAQVLAERLREQVANSKEIKLKHGFVVNISIGVAQINTHDSQRELIRRADEALYRAKASGRNRVEISL